MLHHSRPVSCCRREKNKNRFFAALFISFDFLKRDARFLKQIHAPAPHFPYLDLKIVPYFLTLFVQFGTTNLESCPVFHSAVFANRIWVKGLEACGNQFSNFVSKMELYNSEFLYNSGVRFVINFFSLFPSF